MGAKRRAGALAAGQEQPPPLEAYEERVSLGARLRRFRQDLGWTLEQASGVTGVGRSTLSKIENGQMSPTFDLLRRLTMRMQIDLVDLFDADSSQEPRGRRSLTLKGQGKRLSSPTYVHELLAADVSRKKMLPFRSRITARSRSEFDGWVRHDGEEIIVVLSGAIEVHTEYYEPVVLHEGDSLYFDSTMGHCAISVGEEDAQVFWVCSIDVFKDQVERAGADPVAARGLLEAGGN
ncbi:helix-turn-helix domain-containing protein [Aquamicrobium soli]|uniref:Helix-turn-helix domain-containing protein n=1 Tax=Aquamicrobium soli TaxID=1811518 RepID=A0ABV7KDQ1_9HYPH